MRYLPIILLGFVFAKCKSKSSDPAIPDDTKNIESKYQITINGSCSYVGELNSNLVYGFLSDEEAKEGLNKTMKYTGLPANFQIMAADVDNACAVIKTKSNGSMERYIMYSQEFMMAVRDMTKNNWAEVSILAHEIGHHLAGHTLLMEKNRPDLELEADKFSGFILYKMGASLADAQIAMKTFSPDTGNSSHPGKKARLAAITNGWVAAKEQIGDKTKVHTDAPPADLEEVNTEELDNEKDIRSVINSWIVSIENKDIDRFASYITYDYSYESADGIKRTYETRISKLKKIFADNSYITIDYNIASIRLTGNDAAVISFYQTYQSEKFNDKGYKYLYLRRESGSWKIFKEAFF